jgi:hypothetical protein
MAIIYDLMSVIGISFIYYIICFKIMVKLLVSRFFEIFHKYYQSLIKIPVIKELKQKTGSLIDICYEYSVSFSENKYDNNKIYEDVEENKIGNEIESENKNSRYNTFKRFVSIRPYNFIRYNWN